MAENKLGTRCPGCRATYDVPAAMRGRPVRCRRCGTKFKVEPELGQNRPTASPTSETPANAIGETRIPCPRCGESIPAIARECRFCGVVLQQDHSDLSANPPPPPPPPVPIAPTDAEFQVNRGNPRNLPGGLTMAGGILLAVGSFLPWITVTAMFVGTISRNGVEDGGDGLYSLGLGVVICIIGYLFRTGTRRMAIPTAILGTLSLGIVILEWSFVGDRVEGAKNKEGAIVSIGSGIYVMALGAVLTILGGLLMTLVRPVTSITAETAAPLNPPPPPPSPS